MVVGTLVVIAAALMVGGILIIGQEARLFAPKISYVTNFDAAGLRVGSPVTMSGVRVGTAERIQLPTNPRSEGITFKISVDRDFSERVRRGTMAQLVLMQIVANERAVDLTPGDPNQPPLKEEGFHPAVGGKTDPGDREDDRRHAGRSHRPVARDARCHPQRRRFDRQGDLRPQLRQAGIRSRGPGSGVPERTAQLAWKMARD